MSKEIWFNNPRILFKKEYILEVWPKKDYNFEQQINSITRLIILLSILGFIFTSNYNLLFLGIIAIICITIIYYFQNTSKENLINNLRIVKPILGNPMVYELNKENFSTPTENNPLMNVLIPEVKFDPCRKSAGPTFNPVVEENINDSVRISMAI